MGYHLSSLANLPFFDDVKFYLLVVSDGINGPEYKELQNNFIQIARTIGPTAVIAQGFDEELFSDEVTAAYLGHGDQKFFELFPAIILTDTHPLKLSPGSMRIIIPLRAAREKFGDLPTFFSALAAFCKGRNPELLAQITSDPSQIVRIMRQVNDVAIMQPTFLGFGVNINALVNKLLDRGI